MSVRKGFIKETGENRQHSKQGEQDKEGHKGETTCSTWSGR